MSKWGFEGGYKRPPDDPPRFEKAEPSLEELARIRQLRALKDKRSYDRKFGGPVFSARQIRKATFSERQPLAATCLYVVLLGSALVVPWMLFTTPRRAPSALYQRDQDELIWSVHERHKNSLIRFTLPGRSRYLELKKIREEEEE